MRKRMLAAVMLSGLLVFSGCSAQSGNVTGLTSDRTPNVTSPIIPDPAPGRTDAVPDIAPVSKRDAIPFEGAVVRRGLSGLSGDRGLESLCGAVLFMCF